jgi:hypothetical protein
MLAQIALSRLVFFSSVRSLATLAQLTTFVFPFHKFMFEAYNGVPRRVSIRQFAMPLVFLVVVSPGSAAGVIVPNKSENYVSGADAPSSHGGGRRFESGRSHSSNDQAGLLSWFQCDTGTRRP